MKAVHCASKVASTAIVKASVSHNSTCESSAGTVGVVKHAASAGLQCIPELVKDNAVSLKVSHN